MLFDPKWQEAKADPFSLESLIAWLEKQPAKTPYDYCWPETCLVAQYLRAQGVRDYVLGTIDLDRIGWKEIAQGHPFETDRWTFGAALSRARALQTSSRIEEDAPWSIRLVIWICPMIANILKSCTFGFVRIAPLRRALPRRRAA